MSRSSDHPPSHALPELQDDDEDAGDDPSSPLYTSSAEADVDEDMAEVHRTRCTFKQLVTSRAGQQQVLQAVHAAGLEQQVLHARVSTAEAQKDAAIANRRAADEVLRQRTAELDRFRAEYDQLTAAKLSTEEQLSVKDAQVADLQQQVTSLTSKSFVSSLAKPTSFTGSPAQDKMPVREWLSIVKDYLYSSNIARTDVQRVQFAEGYLKAEARRAWIAFKVGLHKPTDDDSSPYAGVTFAAFEKHLLQRWNPTSSEVDARTKLDMLSQAHLSITAFVNRFEDLCTFLPSMDEGDKVHKFLTKLDVAIQSHCAINPATGQRWTSYEAAKEFAVNYCATVASAANTRKRAGALQQGINAAQGALTSGGSSAGWQQHKLYCRLHKCHFGLPNVEYLGHIVGENGIRVDPRKVKIVQDWPAPKTQSELPFDLLKEKLTHAPVLAMPDFEKPFEIVADASNTAVGAILLQDGKPIAFESRKLTPAEVAYDTMEREMTAVIHALTVWRPYVDQAEITVFSDHEPLRYLRTKPTLTPRQIRWSQFMERFYYKWEFRAGRLNVADPLSRAPHSADGSGMGNITGRPLGPDDYQLAAVSRDRTSKRKRLNRRNMLRDLSHVLINVCLGRGSVKGRRRVISGIFVIILKFRQGVGGRVITGAGHRSNLLDHQKQRLKATGT
eukprot:gene4793-5042_t